MFNRLSNLNKKNQGRIIFSPLLDARIVRDCVHLPASKQGSCRVISPAVSSVDDNINLQSVI